MNVSCPKLHPLGQWSPMDESTQMGYIYSVSLLSHVRQQIQHI